MAEVLKVLVIDDEPGMRMGVERALRDFTLWLADVNAEAAFEVLTAGTAEEGLDIINERQPDILLLDYKLPGMSGLDLLGKLPTNDVDMLTVMITAYASLETAVEATKRGAYDFLAKPFSPAELKNMIRKASSRLIFKREAKKLAEEKRQVRFQFISVLAHELKSPLAAIEGYLNMIREKTAGDDPVVYERMVDRSLIRLEGMRKLIMDLLDMTRIESAQKKREFSEVNLRQLAEMAVEGNAKAAADRGITINMEVPEDLQMQADRGEIEIILNNLVSNAVKYNRDGGGVDIEIFCDGKVVTIKVSDTGIGMSEAETKKLFNDFVRIKNEKTHKILGSGLGLSIVKKLAMLYNGNAKVSSEPDVGSTFTVTLEKDAEPFEEAADKKDESKTDTELAK